MSTHEQQQEAAIKRLKGYIDNELKQDKVYATCKDGSHEIFLHEYTFYYELKELLEELKEEESNAN